MPAVKPAGAKNGAAATTTTAVPDRKWPDDVSMTSSADAGGSGAKPARRAMTMTPQVSGSSSVLPDAGAAADAEAAATEPTGRQAESKSSTPRSKQRGGAGGVLARGQKLLKQLTHRPQ